MQILVREGYIQSLFFVLYEDGRLLILDGACSCDFKDISVFLEGIIDKKDLSSALQLVSHMHPDHAGAAPLVNRDYQIAIAAPEGINRWYSGFGGFLQHKIDICLAYFVVRSMKKPLKSVFYKRKLNMDYPLKDGDTLPYFPDWQALFTPGHTNHDMVFYHQESRTLYAADLILNIGGRYQLPFPVSFPEEMFDSLLRVRNLKVETLILAHGGILKVDGIEKIVDELLYSLEKKPLRPVLRRLKPLTRFSPALKTHFL